MSGLNPSLANGSVEPELKHDLGPANLAIKVVHGPNQHEVALPSNSTFGDLKSVIVKKIGIKPDTHKLLFRGKEKDDDESLQIAGVKDNGKVLLVEDTSCKEKDHEEVKETNVNSQGGAAVAQVREEVDKLADQVAALQAVVDSGTKVDNKDIIYLTEMLMRQLLKLDGIEAEGEGKVQRKMEVRRVQSIVETVDILKSRNSNPSSNDNNAVSITTQWETFETGSESASTMSTAPSPTPTPHPIPVPSSTPTPHQIPVPSSMPNPHHIPVASSTPTVPSSTPTPHPIPIPSSMPTPHHIPVPSSTPIPIPSSTPIPVPSSTPTPHPIPISSSMPIPQHIPVPSSTPIPQHIPVSSSTPIPHPIPIPSCMPITYPTPAPSPMPIPHPTSVPSPMFTPYQTPITPSMPTPAPMMSSTPSPTPFPSFTPTPVPFTIPTSAHVPSSASSLMQSSTKVTQEWEHFD